MWDMIKKLEFVSARLKIWSKYVTQTAVSSMFIKLLSEFMYQKRMIKKIVILFLIFDEETRERVIRGTR